MGVLKRSEKYTAGMMEPRTTCFFFVVIFYYFVLLLTSCKSYSVSYFREKFYPRCLAEF